MKPEVKEKWVAALRSGEYQQGRMGLRSGDNKFCCLGVLCDLYAREIGAEWGEPLYIPEEGRTVLTFGKTLSTDFPPSDVRVWAGLNDMNPSVTTQFDGSEIPVAILNDGNDLIPPQSFVEIADLIEASL